jgi:hypothetical protein
MRKRDEAEADIFDPLEPLDDVADEWNCTKRFLIEEEKRGRLKIVRLSYRMLRMRRSEKRRYVAAQEAVA